MKVISLWQPWATLMAIDVKHNETRSWGTSYRGDLLIHSAKRVERMIADELYRALGIPLPVLFPLGAALCVVEVYDVVRTEMILGMPRSEELCGDYRAGRFAWLTRNLRVLREPLPMHGAQGLRDVPVELEIAVRERLAR